MAFAEQVHMVLKVPLEYERVKISPAVYYVPYRCSGSVNRKRSHHEFRDFQKSFVRYTFI